MSKSRTSFRRRLLRAGIAIATTAVTVAAVTAVATPAHAATVPLTLSSTSAADTAVLSPGVTVVASSTSAWLSAATTTSAKVLLNTATACAVTYGAPAATAIPAADSGNLTKYSSYVGSFFINLLPQPTVTTTYRVCVYTGSSSANELIGNSAFTVFVNPDVSTGPAAISVAAGPASGGTRVTVTGATLLPTTAAGYTSVTVGGAVATGLTAINATSVSFLTAPHAPAAAQPIIINLASGASVTLTPTFTYLSAITVTPNSGLSTANTAIYITGGGFNAMNAFGAINTATAHIYLTRGGYLPTINGANVFATASTPVTQCLTPVKLSDTEIICTLDVLNTLNAAAGGTAWVNTTNVSNGAYTVSLINDGTLADLTVTGANVVTPSATFTVTDYPTA